MNQSWMLPEEAFIWIEENIPFGSSILEFGSGHGSIRLSENYSVTSVEHNPDWLDVAPVNYIYAPIVENKFSTEVGEVGWYDVSVLKGQIPEKIDLVIVDGPPGHVGRTGILSIIEDMSHSYWILLDDVDREPEAALGKKLESIYGINPNFFVCKVPRENGSERQFTIFNLGDKDE